jgi:serine/threonine protein kinase
MVISRYKTYDELANDYLGPDTNSTLRGKAQEYLAAKSSITFANGSILQIRDKLGQGSQGAIYLAKLTSADGAIIDLAVKRQTIRPYEATAVNFANEFDVSRGLNGGNAHVLAFDGGYRIKNPDGSLEFFTFMKRGSPFPDTGLRGTAHLEYARGVFEGMQSLHARGVVHRDIKRDNSLIVDGKSALIDLGIAMRIKSLGKQPFYIGSWVPFAFTSPNRFGSYRQSYIEKNSLKINPDDLPYDPKKQDIFNFSVLYLDTKLPKNALEGLLDKYKSLAEFRQAGGAVINGEELLQKFKDDYPNLLSVKELAILTKTMKNNPFERGGTEDLAELFLPIQ